MLRYSYKLSLFGHKKEDCSRGDMAKNNINNNYNLTVCVIVYLCLNCVKAAGTFTTKIGPKPLWNATFVDRLRHDLLLNYDKFARPAQHYNVTTVQFNVRFRHFETNEFKSTLTAHCWLQVAWRDEKLKWSPADYGNLQVLRLADHEIWQPDIFLYNSATSTSINHYTNTHCLVDPLGQILWVPPAQFSVLCNFDLSYWPFDVQICDFRFGSWTHHGGEINITLHDNATFLDSALLTTNIEWKPLDVKSEVEVTYYNCCKEAYPSATFTVTLARNSPFYKAIIITPIFVIVFLTLLAFWLPPQSGEKVVLNGCTIILNAMFLFYLAQKLPAFGDNIPYIVLFYSSSFYTLSFSTLTSIIVLWLSTSYHNKPLPWVIKQQLQGRMGYILLLPQHAFQVSAKSQRVTAEEMRDHQISDFEDHVIGDDQRMIQLSHKPWIQQEWVILAIAIDRISFLLYGLIFALLAIVYAV